MHEPKNTLNNWGYFYIFGGGETRTWSLPRPRPASPHYRYMPFKAYIEHNSDSSPNQQNCFLKTPSYKNWGFYESSGGETRTWTGDT